MGAELTGTIVVSRLDSRRYTDMDVSRRSRETALGNGVREKVWSPWYDLRHGGTMVVMAILKED